MIIRYNTEKLKSILNDLCMVTNISFAILDVHFDTLFEHKAKSEFCELINKSSLGFNKCLCSDTIILETCQKTRQFQTHICHAGLRDAATPIIKNDIIVGYILMGRIRSSSSSDNICKNLSWLNLDLEILKKSYNALPFYSDEQIISLSNLLSHILFENAVEIDFNDFINRATTYIKDNLHEELTISHLCSTLHVSKNVLYKSFRDSFDCTVNEYITTQRTKKAKQLLMGTDETISRIAEAVGIDNYPYFCRLFKKLVGISPSEYRKTH